MVRSLPGHRITCGIGFCPVASLQLPKSLDSGISPLGLLSGLIDSGSMSHAPPSDEERAKEFDLFSFPRNRH